MGLLACCSLPKSRAYEKGQTISDWIGFCNPKTSILNHRGPVVIKDCNAGSTIDILISTVVYNMDGLAIGEDFRGGDLHS